MLLAGAAHWLPQQRLRCLHAALTGPVLRGMQAYKNYVAAILTRVNTITGIRYSSDPTIFAWELANEPRTSKGYDAQMGLPHGSTVKAWVSELAAYFRSLDPNHMVRPSSPHARPGHACHQQGPRMKCHSSRTSPAALLASKCPCMGVDIWE